MNLKILIPIIAVISVGAMIIWGTLANDWSKCWLACFAGGIAIAVVSMIMGAKKEKNKDSKENNQDSSEEV